jgi:hypothetical protein
LISDVSAVRKLGLPLLQPGESALLSYSAPVDEDKDKLVALNLRLPVLANVPVKEVLKIRHDHSAEFERFRGALQKAIEEQLARNETASPEIVARDVVEEYVQPELATIESKLDVSKKALVRKIGANVTVAGAAVSVGAISNVPLVIASGNAAIIPSFGPINQYFDNKSDIELSDL